ncbi:MAG: hypothetical protein K2N05_09210 [Muribaculaceae bacterium]|nr:hypothetical protein [Muribaculaceae bacterium]
MALTIHPHKGYLNTNFHIHYSGNGDLRYNVFDPNDSSHIVAKGVVSSNKPYQFKIPTPGEYKVRFENGEIINLVVEDAYKFGGSRLKKAFVFDTSPWLFVVMYDRTYFHNRDTGEEYIETISPDEIQEVSEGYVLLNSNGQRETTLFSLFEQKPIAEFVDVVTYNHECIVYEENEDSKTYICVYSLQKDKRVVKIAVDDYKIFGNELFFFRRNLIQKLSLYGDFNIKSLLLNHKGLPVAFINNDLAVTYINGVKRTLFIYSIGDSKIINEIDINGYLHSINGKCLFNIYDRRLAINRFNIEQAGFPEANITVQYDDVDIYDCEWDIFYCIKSSKLTKTPHQKISEEVSFTFNSYCENNEINFSGLNCDVTVHNQSLLIVIDHATYLITPEPSLIKLEDGKYDKQKFEQDGIIVKSLSNETVMLKKEYLSKEAHFKHFEAVGYTDLLSMGYKFRSPADKFAVEIEYSAVYLITRQDDSNVKVSRILEKLFDYSNYKNVLFSEDGSKVMYRTGKVTSIVDIASGEEQNYSNLSYILHVNGIRPSFDIDKKRQVVLVNPITGLQVPSEALYNHSFISPDEQIYADTNLDSYIERHYRFDDRLLSMEEYNELLKRFSFSGEKGSKEFTAIKLNRENIVKQNLSHFKKFARNAANRSDNEWIEYFVDEKQIWGNEEFMNYIVEKRGIAVIKRLSNNSVITRINLGKPLWFLNYVSFSYDGRYVAIAGRYPDNTHDDEGNSLGGLFLCYDLLENKIVFKKTDYDAVWLTAFTKAGNLAAYTSNPITFIVNPGKAESSIIRGYSFLTFSPDGRYFALSKKGYVRKDSRRSDWGHQKSTEVFICPIDNPEEIICSYNDLDGRGIDNLASLVRRKESIASVAFSNNHKQLLMVGEDGVMIVRNLHLEEYAAE